MSMNTASNTPTGSLAKPTSAVDPVCGMTVQADKAAARMQYGGKLYLFCSTHCQHQFETDPKKYIGAAGAATPVPEATGAPVAALTAAAPDHGM
ncbi:MAG: YHS domain-containing protein, partial [Rhodoferax sp.]|nr:YHS domain-containing protein [Rhodoferax sp.]